MPHPNFRLSLKDRFFEKTIRDPKLGCLIWVGAITSKGYGSFWTGTKSQSAHHVAWFLANGTFPDLGRGEDIDHTCGDPTCVEISHLRKVSHQENMLASTDIICPECGSKKKSYMEGARERWRCRKHQR